MSRRIVPLAAAIALLAACASSEPVVDGFTCGPFGERCPPESRCEPVPCDHSDCEGQCIATTPCEPASDHCPNPTACDPSTKRCMPRKTCTKAADCNPNEACLTGTAEGAGRYTRGICGIE